MAARSGMIYLINKVRQLAKAGDDDYTVALETYWSDDHLQDILDLCRVDVYERVLRPIAQTNSGGTVEYKAYEAPPGWWEESTNGTAIWFLQDDTGALVGTADYSVAYATGRITFAADQSGSARYLTGRTYDVFEAAAQVWDEKAAHVADRYDFSADGASFKASQLVTQYERQAARLRARSPLGGVRTHRFVRDDVTC